MYCWFVAGHEFSEEKVYSVAGIRDDTTQIDGYIGKVTVLGQVAYIRNTAVKRHNLGT